jgi:hypothetical protein
VEKALLIVALAYSPICSLLKWIVGDGFRDGKWNT